MKITIEHEDGKVEVFQDVLDLYLAVRHIVPFMKSTDENALPVQTLVTRSYSWGVNMRELLKELRQSTVELEKFLSVHNVSKEVTGASDRIN